nr:tigger transposable element-derived protein 6-like [Dermacentor andersoni]
MTRDIFQKWLKAWDSELACQGRKVCLIVDNCTAHHTDAQLSSIEIHFLPPNTTSKLQPLDQGIIHAFKSIYKRQLIDILLLKLRMGQELKTDLLSAIQMLKASWDNVKQSTIVHCSWHVGFVSRIEEASEEATEDLILDGTEEECQLEETWSQLERFVGAEPHSMCIEDFVGGDDSTGTVAELTDVEIAAEVTAERPNEDAAEADPASADVAPLLTATEAVAALAVVRRYCGAIEGTGLSLVDRLDYVEDAVVKHAVANMK